jgi:hypothetical protein
MTLHTLDELTAYWLAMPTAVPALKGVTVGMDYAMLSAMSASIQYPHLRVDTPTITFLDVENDYRTRYSYVVSVLMNVPVVDNQRENAALGATLEILKDVYRQVYHDSTEDKFDLILESASGFDVQRYSGDNDFGWSLKINLELSNKSCD